MRKLDAPFLLISIVSVLYCVWAVVYILNTSFIAINGSRYFSLLDDAMVSMRYAWNLSHGNGLVWNVGEYVEGYSNLLTTLMMSLVTVLFDKKTSVVVVQLLGIPTVLSTAWMSRKIFDETNRTETPGGYFAVVVYSLVVLYYPLSYWSLFGMETGLLSLMVLFGVFFTLRWLRDPNDKNLRLLSLFWGLSFLTRNDALIIVGISYLYLLSYVMVEKRSALLKKLIWAGSITALFVCGQTLFRWIYYGDILPNTYYLKLGQIPVTVRINDGLLYSWDFLKEHWLVFILITAGTLFLPARNKWYLISLIFGALFYQFWVGGDSWGRWRFVTPVIPIAVVLIVSFGVELEKIFRKRPDKSPSDLLPLKIFNALFPFLLLVLIGLEFLRPYYLEINFSNRIPDVARNAHNVDVSIAINAVTDPGASIGVFWAGSIPYYTGRYSVDFLGKSDKYIANLYPWLPRHVVWFEKTTFPGHNKYDLFYSIKDLQPTYIQRNWYAGQTLRSWTVKNYVRFEYTDKLGTYTLMLKKDSPYVHWNQGTIIPWFESK